jgi:hypothetical protein
MGKSGRCNGERGLMMTLWLLVSGVLRVGRRGAVEATSDRIPYRLGGLRL